MDSLILEVINCASKISKQKVMVQSISTLLNNKDAYNFDNDGSKENAGIYLFIYLFIHSLFIVDLQLMK